MPWEGQLSLTRKLILLPFVCLASLGTAVVVLPVLFWDAIEEVFGLAWGEMVHFWKR
jgi:hypothetical protein